MAFRSSASSPRDELLDLAEDALAEYESMNSDLSGLVADVGGILVELAPISDERWTSAARDSLHKLTVASRESGSYARVQVHTPAVTEAISSLRALIVGR